MTDLRTEIQSAIMDHIHEVRGVAALTDAIMRVVGKQSDDVHLWRFWNDKARELAASNDSLRQQLAYERNKALEDAAGLLTRQSFNVTHHANEMSGSFLFPSRHKMLLRTQASIYLLAAKAIRNIKDVK